MLSAIEYASFLVKNGIQVGQHFNGRDVQIVERYCLGIIQRQVQLCGTIKKLLDPQTAMISDEIAIGIILRALLLDALITMDLYIKMLKTPNVDVYSVLETFCNEVMIDDANQSLSRSIKNMSNSGVISQKQKEEFLSNIPCSKKTGKYTAGEIERRLAQGEFRNYVDDLSRIYDLYSKYDHYNNIYFRLQEEEITTKRERYTRALCYIIHSLATSSRILSFLNPSDDKLIELVDKVLLFSLDYTTYKVAKDPLGRSPVI